MGKVVMGPPKTLVLMYHQIDPEGVPDTWVPNDLADPRYGVKISIFREQMSILKSLKIPTLGLNDLLEGSAKSHHLSVVITFDDGYSTDLEQAAPVLSDLDIPATFFLATGHMGREGMMTPSQARELSHIPGFELGSHGVTHRFLSHLSKRDCEEEMKRSIGMLANVSGENRFSLSAPGGRTNECVASLAKLSGFFSLSTSKPGIFCSGDDHFSIPRLPIMKNMTSKDFIALLNPDSFSFQTNKWIRIGKSLVQSALEFQKIGSRKAP